MAEAISGRQALLESCLYEDRVGAELEIPQTEDTRYFLTYMIGFDFLR